MERPRFIAEALAEPDDSRAYYISRRMAECCPDRAVLQTADCDFDPHGYARDERCRLLPKLSIHCEWEAEWAGEEKGLRYEERNGWHDVFWQGNRLELLQVSWSSGRCSEAHYWITAEALEVCESFFIEVCRWGSRLRDEIWVFEDGYWERDAALYREVRKVTFDSLILAGDLKKRLQEDLRSFFASRAEYVRHGAPWKRGILFIGPPGNGKTHAIKALIGSLPYPCLYVKGLDDACFSDKSSIERVFLRARECAPCLLVFEDLDSLLKRDKRSVFLNALDGFATNDGIVTLATTNHPQKLDAAILDRPSRFDRKYHFDLPGPAEREAYLAHWNQRLEQDLRLGDEALPRLAEITGGFSFAYLKELVLSVSIRLVSDQGATTVAELFTAEVKCLRQEMQTARDLRKQAGGKSGRKPAHLS